MEHLLQITSTKRDGSTYQCKRRVRVVEDGRKNHNLQQKEEQRHLFELQQRCRVKEAVATSVQAVAASV